MAAIFFFPADMNAQYGKKKKRPPKETEETVRQEKTPIDLIQKLWYGVNIGNPFIGNNTLVIGIGPMAGYKFNRFFSAGIITDVNYTYRWRNGGPNEHYFDLSGGVFGRARFLQSFYAHVEYNITSLDRVDTTKPRTNFPVLFVGGGYSSRGRGPWAYEATLLFDTLGNLGSVTNSIPVVYRLGLTYNF